MTRRYSLAALALLVFVFPLTLASQSSDASHATKFAIRSTGGCSVLLADAASGTSATGSAEQAAHGFAISNLDRSVSPCDDFFKFADGGWLKDHPIPADHVALGSFDLLHDHNEDVLHQILEDAEKDKTAAPGSNLQKIGDFYASCMDESQVETAGLKPLEPELKRIADIKDAATLQDEIARLQRSGVNAVFAFGSEQDLKDSTEVIAGAGQGGLGMPDRQYYLDDDVKSKQLRESYIQHVTNMFKLMGDDAATSAAESKAVLDIETALAKASKKREDLRDPESNYHRLPMAQLGDLTPHLKWTSFFREMGAPSMESADIGQPDFFKAVDAAFINFPIADWKTYLRWHLINATAAALPASFVNENFAFARALTGVQALRPRWRRCVDATDRELGEALGQIYVERNFPPEAKIKAIAMVRNLMTALRGDLATLDWMSPATREQAAKKLDAITLKIGYPDKWRDYSAYHVDRGPYVANLIRGNAFETARDLAKIGKPVDRTEWGMTPPTVNAYYNPSMNEIVFPAGILQPPFFDPKADDAINYGGIGSVIGHEMTHGFDDQGAKFDGQGNLKNWWTPEDLKNFQARGECIAKQFDAFEIEPGLHGNGKLEEGESIADLGGMNIAYAAFQKTLAGKPAPAPIDGFTAEQRFFLGWAQIWEENMRPEYARLIAKVNEHPLNKFRTTGPLSNTPAFAKAFGCAADSAMVRPEGQRCRIW
ncbi:MAG TPA: M13 family metallopeptidase [Candidatus Acidoferrales bacterium]|nr:M13 family metallopeptidase [Candidatus Acidoferrales bacterium]